METTRRMARNARQPLVAELEYVMRMQPVDVWDRYPPELIMRVTQPTVSKVLRNAAIGLGEAYWRKRIERECPEYSQMEDAIFEDRVKENANTLLFTRWVTCMRNRQETLKYIQDGPTLEDRSRRLEQSIHGANLSGNLLELMRIYYLIRSEQIDVDATGMFDDVARSAAERHEEVAIIRFAAAAYTQLMAIKYARNLPLFAAFVAQSSAFTIHNAVNDWEGDYDNLIVDCWVNAIVELDSDVAREALLAKMRNSTPESLRVATEYDRRHPTTTRAPALTRTAPVKASGKPLVF